MISNLLVRRGYLSLAHLMNGQPRPMRMPNCLKKNLKDGMTRGYKSVSLGDYVLLYNSHLRFFFVGKLLSKWEGPYIREEDYRSGAIKINNAEGTNPKVVNGQRLKHYISSTPINVETNLRFSYKD